jgi:hypothetical protein
MRRSALLACLLTASLPAPTSAQGAQEQDIDPVARQRFLLATELYRQGRFVDAAQEFERVYEATRHADLLHNVYVAYRDAGEKRKAADALRSYLAEAEEIPDRTVMEGRLATLERELAEDGARTPPPTEPAETEPVGPGPTTPPPSVPPPPPAGDGPDALAPAIVLAVGAGAAIVGGVLGVVAAGQYSELEDDCGSALICRMDREADIDGLRTTALLADVLVLGGGLVAVVGGTWLVIELTSGGEERATTARVSPWCTADGCGASIRGLL